MTTFTDAVALADAFEARIDEPRWLPEELNRVVSRIEALGR